MPPGPLARCSHCGWSDTFTGITVDRPTMVRFEGTQAVCPRCERLADIERGWFQLVPRSGAERNTATISALTAAELLRLSQAARAVQEGRPGATEHFDRVLAEAPEPIRRLSERWTREQKLALASFIVSLMALLVPFVKDDGGVTEQQLVEVIEKLVEQQSDSAGQQGQPEEGAAGGAGQSGAGEGGGPVGATGGDGNGCATEGDHGKSVQRPNQ